MASDSAKTDVAVATTPTRLPAAVGARGVELRTTDDLWRLAQQVVASGIAPRSVTKAPKPEAAAFVIMQMGMECGLSPMMSFQALDVINGSPRWKSRGALAQVRRSGLLESIREGVRGEGDDRVGFCIVVRRGYEPEERNFTVRDAKKAGLWEKRGQDGGPSAWVSYQNRMLQHRARGFALEDVFSDVLLGIETQDKYEGEPEREINEPPVLEAHGPDPLLASLASDVQDAEIVAAPAGTPETPRILYSGGGTLCPVCRTVAIDFEGTDQDQTAHFCEKGHSWDPAGVVADAAKQRDLL